MLNFSDIPYFDDHTHAIDVEHAEISKVDFVKCFMHGYKVASPMGEMDAEQALEYHCSHLGIAQVLIKYLADYYGCEATLDAVVAKRNQLRAEKGPQEYAWELYRDANVVGTTIDLPWPLHDEKEKIFACDTYRLYQHDPMVERLQAECATYDELLEKYEQIAYQAIEDGYIGFKCHVGEKYSFDLRKVSLEEAREAYQNLADYENSRTVYYALFARLLKICMEKNSVVHVHAGCTGSAKHGLIERCNPQLMIPFLNDPEYQMSPIVLLHCNYPNVRAAAELAHSYPNVWVDFAWVLPWAALELPELIKTVLGITPHTKIMMGTGQHLLPEITWLSAKLARKSLEIALSDVVENGFITEAQARETAELLLYRNAYNLYGIKK